jgi:hypothetical protein
VPDFFIVGHHKSGTTALYEMLRRHPQIFMPDVKEPRWFASDLRALVPLKGGRQPQSYEEYLDLFTPAREDQIAGEASPSYLRSATAAQEIAAVQPAARCIAILREPASFVRSMHLQLLQEHVETQKDLRLAFEGEAVERNGVSVLRYSDHIHYVEQLRRYEAVFPPEQLLVLIYDDFRSDNESTVRQVLRFLRVDDSAPVALIEANPTIEARSGAANRILREVSSGRGRVANSLRSGVRALLPAAVRAHARRTVTRRVLTGPPQPVDESLRAELRERFRPEVLALSEHLDRDLVDLWGYDRGR